MIKYYADNWLGYRVTKRTIERETESSVIYGGRRERKVTRDAVYFDSFKEAQDWLIAEMEEKITHIKSSLRIEEEKLNDVRSQRESDL